MKRSIITMAISLITLVFIFSCKPVILNPNLTGNIQYKSIWVGWLDLGEQNYMDLNYGSREEWINEIKRQNINLQSHIRRYMTGFTVKGANAKTDDPPRDSGTIVITFKSTVFDTQTTGMLISTGADFIDAASRKVLMSLEQKQLGSSLFLNTFPNYSLQSRLNNAMSHMSYDIRYYLTQTW